MSPKLVDRELRREEILAAAIVVFNDRGYHAATLGEIARAAGIGQGTLYYYFPTKEEIFWGVHETVMRWIRASIEHRLAEVQDPKTKLATLLELMFEGIRWHGMALGRDHRISQRGGEGKETAAAQSDGQGNGGASPPSGGPGTEPADPILELLREEGQDSPLRAALTHRPAALLEFFIEFWAEARRSPDREARLARFAEIQKWFVGRFAELFAEAGYDGAGVDPETAGHILLALKDGLHLQLFFGTLDRDGPGLDRLKEQILKLLLPP